MKRHSLEVIASMQPAWFKDINATKEPHQDGRTINERCFDSGVFAASEFIRRLTGDEDLALTVHEVCIWKQRERSDAPENDSDTEERET